MQGHITSRNNLACWFTVHEGGGKSSSSGYPIGAGARALRSATRSSDTRILIGKGNAYIPDVGLLLFYGFWAAPYASGTDRSLGCGHRAGARALRSATRSIDTHIFMGKIQGNAYIPDEGHLLFCGFWVALYASGTGHRNLGCANYLIRGQTIGPRVCQ